MPVAIELLAECPVDGIERRLFVVPFTSDVMQRAAFRPVSLNGNNVMIPESDQIYCFTGLLLRSRRILRVTGLVLLNRGRGVVVVLLNYGRTRIISGRCVGIIGVRITVVGITVTVISRISVIIGITPSAPIP
jgi:hypothetical protein